MNRLLRTSFILMLMVAGRAPVEAAELISAVSQSTSTNSASRNRTGYNKDLTGLHGLSDKTSGYLEQPTDNFDALYKLAQQGQQELGTLTKQIALMTQTNAVVPPLKTRDRAQAKITSKYQGQVAKITDIARTSLVSNSSYELMSAFELLDKETEILQIKNRFKAPKQSGYRDINLLVRLPKSQMIVEIQLHLQGIQAVKNGPEHNNYEQIQLIERTAQQADRTITEIEQKRITQLRIDSQSQYQLAWQQQLMSELKTSFQKVA